MSKHIYKGTVVVDGVEVVSAFSSTFVECVFHTLHYAGQYSEEGEEKFKVYVRKVKA